MKKITLNKKEIDELLKENSERNHFQNLLWRLRKNLNHDTGEVVLTDKDVNEILWFASGWAPHIFQRRANKLFLRHIDELLNLVKRYHIPRKYYRI